MPHDFADRVGSEAARFGSHCRVQDLELEPPSPRPRYLDWTMSQSPAAWPGTVLHPHCPEAGPCFARLVRLVDFQR
jgi:hypothetical protein